MVKFQKLISRELALDVVHNRENYISSIDDALRVADGEDIISINYRNLMNWKIILKSPEKMKALEAFGLGFGLDIEHSSGRVWADSYNSKRPIPVERLALGKFRPISKVKISLPGVKDGILVKPSECMKIIQKNESDTYNLKGAEVDVVRMAVASHSQHYKKQNMAIAKVMMENSNTNHGAKINVMSGKFIGTEDNSLYVGKGEAHGSIIIYNCDDNLQLHQNTTNNTYALTSMNAKPIFWVETPDLAFANKTHLYKTVITDNMITPPSIGRQFSYR